MANEITASADLGDNENGNISNWSVSKMISLLKSSFLPKDFAKVEAVLMAREDKAKLEIEALKQERCTFSYKFEEERLEKMGLADELRKCKKEFEETRSEMSKLREENKVLREREKFAEERCKRLLEEVKRMGEKDHEIIDLRSKNCELECAKEKAESEMEILRLRYEVLDNRVSSLESGLPMLRDQDDLKNNNRSVEPVKANGHSPNAGSWGLPSQNIVEIVDIDGGDDCAPVEILSVENGNPSLKRERTSSKDVGEGENGDNDDSTLSEKLKMRKLQEPVSRPDDCPPNHCSTSMILSDINEVNRGFATPREDFMVSGQRERGTESEQKSRDLMNGFPLAGLCFSEESSVSSDSDSDDDSDGVHISFNHSQLAPEAQRENRN